MTKNPTVQALQRLRRKIRKEAHSREETARRIDPMDERNTSWVRHQGAAEYLRLVETWVDAEMRRAKE